MAILGFFGGTPKGTRTPDLLIRSQSLYPTELSAHNALINALRYNSTVIWKKQVLFSIFQKTFLIPTKALSALFGRFETDEQPNYQGNQKERGDDSPDKNGLFLGGFLRQLLFLCQTCRLFRSQPL